jgi:ATP-binding protein involved in chromosome partitioning
MAQNMSVFTCPNCQHSTHVFGVDGVERECKKHEIDLLGNIPLHASICLDADRGNPTVAAEPDGPHAMVFGTIAGKVSKKLFG